MKNMTRSLADLFKNLEVDNQNVHQSILKLVRTCSAIEKMQKSNDEPKNTWIRFVEFVVSTLCFGDQQHFYNLGINIRWIYYIKILMMLIFILKYQFRKV